MRVGSGEDEAVFKEDLGWFSVFMLTFQLLGCSLQ